MGDYPQALNYAMAANKYYEGRSRNRRGSLRLLRNDFHNHAYTMRLMQLGFVYVKLEDYDHAIEAFNKAKFYDIAGYPESQYIYRGLAEAYRGKKQYDKAIEFHKKSCELADKMPNSFRKVYIYASYARTLRELNRHAEAVPVIKLAIQAIESQRSFLQSEGLRASFLEDKLSIYNAMIGSLVALNRPEEAFEYAEHSRSRAFLDILGNKTDLSKGKAREFIGKERELKSRIMQLESMLADQGGTPSTGGRKKAAASDKQTSNKDDEQTTEPEDEEPDESNTVDRAALRKEFEAAQAEYYALLARIRSDDPETASLLTVSPLTLRETQALLDDNVQMLAYYVLPKRTIVWSITKQKVTMRSILIDKDSLMKLVRQFRHAIESRANKYVVNNLSRELYNLLLKDIVAQGSAELVIVPHDFLHYLPFQALMTQDDKYMVEKYSINYLSSASLLQYVVEKRKGAKESLLAFGNPTLGSASEDLVFAEREVNDISANFPKSEIYVKKAATRVMLRQRSAAFSILHFATHGELNETNPMESSLRLAVAGDDSGRLTTRDIFNLDLKASLVVLSSCETALGKIATGDEVIGFTRAFIYAGSPSVVTTLWEINDQATSLLMLDFYKNLMTRNKSEALRISQINLMKKYPHPFYWSPFILSGDYR
jgi:CHAT domain-containing protein